MTTQKLSAAVQAFVDAARNGDSRAVAQALEQGMDPNTREGSHPVLTLAAFGGHVAVARLLIAAGAELDAYDAAFKTALHVAVGRCDFRLAEVLLDAGADINAQRNPGYSATPLHDAVSIDIREGGSERTAFLLRRGADIARRSYIGLGMVSEQGDAIAQALSMPDNKGAALASLMSQWGNMGEGQRALGQRAIGDKNRFKL